MEKICIVKRRREYAQPEVKITLPNNDNVAFPPKVAASNTVSDNRPKSSNKKIVEEFVDSSSMVISITMTKEQSELLQQSEYIRELLEGMKKDPSLDIKLTEDGQLALNFHYNDSLLLRMLRSNQVCQMLQISQSFLRKLINEKQLNSYKLGRMRRFLLEDVLEYLCNDTEFSRLNNKQ